MPGRRGELKYIDVNNYTTYAPAGNLNLLNGLAPGTGPSQRIGRKVKFLSMLFRGAISSGATGANVFRGMVRTLIVFDKQTNATAPTVNDILETADATSPMDMNNRDRFVVLYNKLHAIDQAGGHQSAYVEFYKKISLSTIFNAGVAGTVADITTGSIYLVVLGANGEAAVPTNNPGLYFYSRLRYDDS